MDEQPQLPPVGRPAITEDQVRVYALLTDIVLKGFLTIAAMVAFFWILKLLIDAFGDGKLEFGGIFAALEALLVGTLYQVYAHYFPKRRNGSHASAKR